MRQVLVMLVALLGVVLPEVSLAQEGWQIDSFASDIAIQSDGSILVTEEIAVDFNELEKHGIFRDIPYRYDSAEGDVFVRIEDVVVMQDGEPAETEVTRNDRWFRIRVGDPEVTIQGFHTYEITYRVWGALRSFGEYDEVYWNVTGDEWEVPIAEASVQVQLPTAIIQAACYVGERGSQEPCQQIAEADRQVSFTAESLVAGEGVTVAVGFVPGVVPIVTVSAPPQPADVLLSPVTGGLALLVALLGAGVWGYRWSRYGRDRYWQRAHLPGVRSDRDRGALPEKIVPVWYRKPVSVEYDPPDDLRPAEMGVLLDEQADTLDVTATIIDLAARGYIEIFEQEKKWVFGKKDYELVRTDMSTGGLLAYEDSLLSRLFADGERVKLSELKNSFYQDLKKIKDALYGEVVHKRLFAQRPDKVRLRYGLAAGALTILGGALVMGGLALVSQVGLLSWYHFGLVGVGIGSVVAGIVGLLFHPFMPRKTAYGRELYERVQGYELFVSGTEKYRAKFYEDEQLFVQVLPYAIMFGVTDQLAKAFADMGVEPPQPVWWHGANSFQAAAFTASMDSFSQSLSSAIASSPSGSGSSGGGFSGGGFGGGGGGSW